MIPRKRASSTRLNEPLSRRRLRTNSGGASPTPVRDAISTDPPPLPLFAPPPRHGPALPRHHDQPHLPSLRRQRVGSVPPQPALPPLRDRIALPRFLPLRLWSTHVEDDHGPWPRPGHRARRLGRHRQLPPREWLLDGVAKPDGCDHLGDRDGFRPPWHPGGIHEVVLVGRNGGDGRVCGLGPRAERRPVRERRSPEGRAVDYYCSVDGSWVGLGAVLSEVVRNGGSADRSRRRIAS